MVYDTLYAARNRRWADVVHSGRFAASADASACAGGKRVRLATATCEIARFLPSVIVLPSSPSLSGLHSRISSSSLVHKSNHLHLFYIVKKKEKSITTRRKRGRSTVPIEQICPSSHASCGATIPWPCTSTGSRPCSYGGGQH